MASGTFAKNRHVASPIIAKGVAMQVVKVTTKNRNTLSLFPLHCGRMAQHSIG
jgi:hypothetical protein